MKIKEGLYLSLERRKVIWSNKIKHFGEPRVMTVGISNFCSNFKWHLFYDLDEELTVQKVFYIGMQIGNTAHFNKTKHGIQLIDMKCRSLNEVKYYFDCLKFEFPTDYFWSMPLFIRISEKVDEYGKVLSPEPENQIPKEILLNHFLDRKLYRTWD